MNAIKLTAKVQSTADVENPTELKTEERARVPLTLEALLWHIIAFADNGKLLSSSPFIPFDQVCHNSRAEFCPRWSPPFAHNPLSKSKPTQERSWNAPFLHGKFEILNGSLLKKGQIARAILVTFFMRRYWCARPMRLIPQPLAASQHSQESARGTSQLVDEILYARRNKHSRSMMRRNSERSGLSLDAALLEHFGRTLWPSERVLRAAGGVADR